MKWNGETEAQRCSREEKWHKSFAVIPWQMDSGGWVWLETFWLRCEKGMNQRLNWHREARKDGTDTPPPMPDRTRPPPPVPHKK